MVTLFQEGGFPMWFLLAFSLLTLLASARFAAGPSSLRLRAALALGAATLFTTLTNIAAALAAVGHHAPDYLAHHAELSLGVVLIQGIAEAMSPAILGFTVLSLTALVLALGFYRALIAPSSRFE